MVLLAWMNVAIVLYSLRADNFQVPVKTSALFYIYKW